MEWAQAQLLLAYQRTKPIDWPLLLDRKKCKHGLPSCMMIGCTRCCDELLYLWMYTSAPLICKTCWRDLQKSWGKT